MNRIDAIVKRIKRKKCIVADIGSDHAFLALSLLKSKNIGKIFNVEINKKPLNNSINNTKQYAKTKKVINVLNDGLRKWKYDKYFDYGSISLAIVMLHSNFNFIQSDFFVEIVC